MTNQSNYGSVLIGKVPTESRSPIRTLTYFPIYFGDDERARRLIRSRGERTVAMFTKVNAINHGNKIGRLCREASRTLRREPQITESQLVKKLTKILLN